MDVLVDVQSVNEEILQRRLAARDAADREQKVARPSVDRRAIDDVVELIHVDAVRRRLNDRADQRRNVGRATSEESSLWLREPYQYQLSGRYTSSVKSGTSSPIGS